MKILHVITGMRKAAGTSVFVGEIAREQVEKGHIVDIVYQETWREDIYPLAHGVNLIAKEEFIKSLPSREYDIMHVHGLWEWMLHVFSKIGLEKNWPMVWSPHGSITPWAMKFKRWKKLPVWILWQKRDLRKASAFHVTAFCEEQWLRDWGFSQPCITAPLGVRIPTHALPTDTPKCREGKTFLFVSRVHQNKGLELLFEAYAKILDEMKTVQFIGRISSVKSLPSLSEAFPKEHPDASKEEHDEWRLRIVGPGEESYVAELKDLAARLGIADKVDFVGAVYGDDLRREYAGADLFVLPTHSENFGSVVIEALAVGVPVICTKGAPWGELEEYRCGWWVDIGVEPIYNAMRLAMSMPVQELHQMGLRGRHLVEEKYTWDTVSRKLLEGYESIIKRGV